MRGGSVLVDNIGSLVTNDPALGKGPLGLVEQAALVVEDGLVAWAGPRSQVPEGAARERFDAEGRAVLPEAGGAGSRRERAVVADTSGSDGLAAGGDGGVPRAGQGVPGRQGGCLAASDQVSKQLPNPADWVAVG